MSRNTATEADASSHEQKLFDLSLLRSGLHQDAESPTASAHPHIHEGYGFRPSSGVATPQVDAASEKPVVSPIPDAYGLGWPGAIVFFPLSILSDHHLAIWETLQPAQR